MIEEDDDVGRGQVETEAANGGGEQHQVDGRVRVEPRGESEALGGSHLQ